MGCAKCGGRMLTKVGRRKPMLICSDCGQPVSEAEATERQQLRLQGSLFMLGLAAVAAMTFFLTHMRATTADGPDPTEQSGEAPSEAAE